MFEFIASLFVAAIAFVGGTDNGGTDYAAVVPPIEFSTDGNVGTIYLPDIAGDDYYNVGDVFRVADSGSLFMVGTDYHTDPDVDWFVLEGTSLPRGFYVLDATRGMVGVPASEVAADYGA